MTDHTPLTLKMTADALQRLSERMDAIEATSARAFAVGDVTDEHGRTLDNLSHTLNRYAERTDQTLSYLRQLAEQTEERVNRLEGAARADDTLTLTPAARQALAASERTIHDPEPTTSTTDPYALASSWRSGIDRTESLPYQDDDQRLGGHDNPAPTYCAEDDCTPERD